MENYMQLASNMLLLNTWNFKVLFSAEATKQQQNSKRDILEKCLVC